MRDLAAVYAGLANDGRMGPLAWTQADEVRLAAAPRMQMIAPTSAQRIGEILREAPSLAGRSPSALARSAPRIAFKTGTSYGYRDAWAAGFAGAYTAIVWVGRADGAPRPGETGRAAAAPILFDLFDSIARFDPAAPLGPTERDWSEDGGRDRIDIARLSAPRRQSPPEIVFPRHGVEVFREPGDDRGLTLAARGGAGGYRWYVGGEEIRPDDASGRASWKPAAPGFYDITVVDADGRAARAKVRVAYSG
jgi:penicillin-binding protein 1C